MGSKLEQAGQRVQQQGPMGQLYETTEPLHMLDGTFKGTKHRFNRGAFRSLVLGVE